MKNAVPPELIVEFVEWLKVQQARDDNVRAINPSNVSALLVNYREKNDSSLASYDISIEALLVAVATNLLSSVIKDGVTAYLSDKNYYHNIIKKKAKMLSIKNLKLLEDILRYASLWIGITADRLDDLSKKIDITDD